MSHNVGPHLHAANERDDFGEIEDHTEECQVVVGPGTATEPGGEVGGGVYETIPREEGTDAEHEEYWVDEVLP